MNAKATAIADTTCELDDLLTESQDLLEDLNSLLAESTKLHQAKTHQRQGKTLSTEQSELLEANHLAEQMQIWEAKQALAHFTDVGCSCGNHFRRFDGWYVLQEHKRQPGTIKLIRGDSPQKLPLAQFVTLEKVAYCHECLSNAQLPVVTKEHLPVLSTFAGA